MTGKPKITRFKESVLSKFQIYNSIFLTLPFDRINKTGVLLPLFHETCLKVLKMVMILQKLSKTFLLNTKLDDLKKVKSIFCLGLFNI